MIKRGLVMLPFTEAKDVAIAAFEESYLSDLLKLTNGNVSEAARVAGLDRSSLYRLIRRVLVNRTKN